MVLQRYPASGTVSWHGFRTVCNSLGSARPVWGTEGREFKSPQPDKQIPCLNRRFIAASVHGRVSNGHQVQVDIGDGTDDLPTAHFARWWKRGFSSWRERAAPGDVFTFVTELGPPPYSIITRGPGSAFSREISDRWEQTLVFKRLAEALWTETTAEAAS